MIFNIVLSVATGLLSGALLAVTLAIVGGNKLHFENENQRSTTAGVILSISLLNAVVIGMVAYRILPQ